MKINMTGCEAIEYGLNCAGIRRLLCSVVREPLHNAEKAISRGSFFACRGEKTACIIAEGAAARLEYALQKASGLNAALVTIIIGKELSYRFIAELYTLRLPLFAAEDVRDIKKMVEDAAKYSELKRLPTAVFIPVRLLRSRESLEINGLCCTENMTGINKTDKELRIRKTEQGYNRLMQINTVYTEERRPGMSQLPGVRKSNAGHQLEAAKSGTGQQTIQDACLIIAISGCAGIVQELTKNAAGISVCKLDMLYPFNVKEIIRSFKHVVIIGHGSRYVEEMLEMEHLLPADSRTIEPGADKLHEAAEISDLLRELLPRNMSLQIGRITASDGILKVRKPTLKPFTDQMCRDCSYRKRIKDMLDDAGGISIYEDIYCETRGTKVRSGMARAESAYTADMIITNRSSDIYQGQNAVVINELCNGGMDNEEYRDLRI